MEEKGHFINALPDSGLVTFLAVVRERVSFDGAANLHNVIWLEELRHEAPKP
jgi:hypothetical protein